MRRWQVNKLSKSWHEKWESEELVGKLAGEFCCFEQDEPFARFIAENKCAETLGAVFATCFPHEEESDLP